MTALPTNWRWATVGQVAEVSGGLTKNAGKRDQSSVRAPLVSVAAVQLRRIDTEAIGEVGLLDSDGDRARLAQGDLLIVEGNGSIEHIGRVALWNDEISGARHQNHIIRVRPRDMASQFVLEWLASPAGRLAIVNEATSAAGLYTLSLSKVERLPIPLPPPDEQRRIVAKLEALQSRSRRAREALDAVPPLLEKLRQSILAAAFRGDLTKDWRAKHKHVEPATELLKRIRIERRKKWEEAEFAKMSAKGKRPTDDKWKAKYNEPEPVDATGLPELPSGWCWASVGELAHVGTGATPKRGDERYYLGGTIAWVTSGALNDEQVTAPTELVTDCAVAETNLTVYSPGTLLLAMYGEGKTRGMVAELRIEAATNQAIAAICLEGSATATKSLVRLALARNYAEIRRVSMGGVQPNLNLEKVRALAVPLCPTDETRVLESVVVAALNRVNRLSDIEREQVGSLDTLNRCVLAKAFRGELVPQDPSDEPAEVMVMR